MNERLRVRTGRRAFVAGYIAAVADREYDDSGKPLSEAEEQSARMSAEQRFAERRAENAVPTESDPWENLKENERLEAQRRAVPEVARRVIAEMVEAIEADLADLKAVWPDPASTNRFRHSVFSYWGGLKGKLRGALLEARNPEGAK